MPGRLCDPTLALNRGGLPPSFQSLHNPPAAERCSSRPHQRTIPVSASQQAHRIPRDPRRRKNRRPTAAGNANKKRSNPGLSKDDRDACIISGIVVSDDSETELQPRAAPAFAPRPQRHIRAPGSWGTSAPQQLAEPNGPPRDWLELINRLARGGLPGLPSFSTPAPAAVRAPPPPAAPRPSARQDAVAPRALAGPAPSIPVARPPSRRAPRTRLRPPARLPAGVAKPNHTGTGRRTGSDSRARQKIRNAYFAGQLVPVVGWRPRPPLAPQTARKSVQGHYGPPVKGSVRPGWRDGQRARKPAWAPPCPAPPWMGAARAPDGRFCRLPTPAPQTPHVPLMPGNWPTHAHHQPTRHGGDSNAANASGGATAARGVINAGLACKPVDQAMLNAQSPMASCARDGRSDSSHVWPRSNGVPGNSVKQACPQGPSQVGSTTCIGVGSSQRLPSSKLESDLRTPVSRLPTGTRINSEEGEICPDSEPQDLVPLRSNVEPVNNGVEFESDTESGEIRSSAEDSASGKDWPLTTDAVSNDDSGFVPSAQHHVPVVNVQDRVNGTLSRSTNKMQSKETIADTADLSMEGADIPDKLVNDIAKHIVTQRKKFEDAMEETVSMALLSLRNHSTDEAPAASQGDVACRADCANGDNVIVRRSSSKSEQKSDEPHISTCRCSRHLKRARHFKNQGRRVSLPLGRGNNL